MKESKFMGYFTNASIQKAVRNADKATILEAVISMTVVFGVEYAADAAWDGTKWIYKKIRKSLSKEGGKK